MSIVPNRDGRPVQPDGRMADPAYASVNRSNAGSPIGALTPLFVNELVQDTTNRELFRATGPTNNDWVLYMAKSL
jgi:hypothetical protein